MPNVFSDMQKTGQYWLAILRASSPASSIEAQIHPGTSASEPHFWQFTNCFRPADAFSRFWRGGSSWQPNSILPIHGLSTRMWKHFLLLESIRICLNNTPLLSASCSSSTVGSKKGSRMKILAVHRRLESSPLPFSSRALKNWEQRPQTSRVWFITRIMWVCSRPIWSPRRLPVLSGLSPPTKKHRLVTTQTSSVASRSDAVWSGSCSQCSGRQLVREDHLLGLRELYQAATQCTAHRIVQICSWQSHGVGTKKRHEVRSLLVTQKSGMKGFSPFMIGLDTSKNEQKCLKIGLILRGLVYLAASRDDKRWPGASGMQGLEWLFICISNCLCSYVAKDRDISPSVWETGSANHTYVE